MDTKEAFDTLKAALQADTNYAWSWHCNIAMAFVDEGGDHERANYAAARFMKQCFDIDVCKSPEWQSLGIKPTEWPEVIG